MKSFQLITVAVALLSVALTQGRVVDKSLLKDPKPTEFDRDEILAEGKVRLVWHVNMLTEMVTFTIIAQTTGWVGFGISEGAITADTVIGGVKNGVPYFTDRFSPSVGLPIIDKEQNWKLLQASETATTTTLTFERAFETGDLLEDENIIDGDIFLIWALGENDEIAYHKSDKGFFGVNLLSPP